jgi:dipeptidyl aminopeptidase/acylaminoacyl peptidase
MMGSSRATAPAIPSSPPRGASTTARSHFSRITTARRPRVVAVHGENDVALAPADARRLLVDRFGIDALERFVELPREGHTFRRVESWAGIYSALLARWNL